MSENIEPASGLPTPPASPPSPGGVPVPGNVPATGSSTPAEPSPGAPPVLPPSTFASPALQAVPPATFAQPVPAAPGGYWPPPPGMTTARPVAGSAYPTGPRVVRVRPRRFWVAMALLGVIVLGLVITLAVVLGLLVRSAGRRTALGGTGYFQEQHIEGTGRDKIAVIEVSGIIMDAGPGLFGEGTSMVERTVKMLRQAGADPDVKAIVLAVDSPGGGVTASDMIYNEVIQLQKKGKKVVVHMGDLCASGGYYISAPADWVIASPTTVTGSIGVIWPHTNAQKLLGETLGLKDESIKSGPHKDMLSMSRPMDTEERQIMQSIIDEMYGRFVKIVVDGRKGKGVVSAELKAADEAVRKIADGRIYTATQAKANGLVDEVDYRERAYEVARTQAGLREASVVRYYRRVTLMDILGGSQDSQVNINTGVQIDAGKLTRDLTPRLEYRWAPGM